MALPRFLATAHNGSGPTTPHFASVPSTTLRIGIRCVLVDVVTTQC
jgi:hypothetical protein